MGSEMCIRDSIKGDTVLNTAVALSTIFQKNDMIPDHIQFDSSYSISLIYGDITVQLGKDADLEEKMNRVIAILPKIQGKKGILHMESVATESNTFEEELEQEEVTAENWNGGYDEDGNSMESAPHAQQKLFIDLGTEIQVYDLLRRAE